MGEPLRSPPILLLGLALFGCAEGPFALPDPTYYEPGITELMREVSGSWSLQTRRDGDCPAKGRTLAPKHTIWERRGDTLVLTSNDPTVPILELQPSSEGTLVAYQLDTHEQCIFYEEHMLDVHFLDGSSMSGAFHTHMGHNGHADCEGWVRGYLLPKRCDTWTDWEAVRIEP